jgi:type II secretory pathway component PulF
MKTRGPSDREVELLLAGLAQSIRAGVSASNHLNAPGSMNGFSESSRRTVIEELAGGRSLTESLERAQALSPSALALLRAAETSGALPEALDQVAEWIKTARQERRTIWAGLAYPVVLLICASVILPLPALVSQGLMAYLFRASIGLGALTAIALLFVVHQRSPDGHLQRVVSAMKTRLPGVRSVVRDGEIARFADVLGRSLGAGITMDAALAGAQDAAGWFGTHKIQLQQVREDIARGQGLSDALAARAVLPRAMLTRIAQAEAIGKLEECLMRESTQAKDRRRATVAKLSAILIAITFAVVTIAIAVQIISDYGKYLGTLDEIGRHHETR